MMPLTVRQSLTVRPMALAFVTQMRESGLSPLAVVSAAISPVAYGVAVIAGYGQPTGALLLGCLAAGLWGGLYAQSALIIVRERAQGTLQLLTVSSSSLSVLMLGRLLAAACQSLAAVSVTAATIVMLFGGIHDLELPLFAVSLAPITAGLLGMSLFLMSVLVLYRYSAGMVNGLFGAVVVLGGFFVPASAMPLAVRVVSSVLPTTWAIQAARPGAAHQWLDLGIAILLAAGWLVIGVVCTAGAQRRLRHTGNYHPH